MNILNMTNSQVLVSNIKALYFEALQYPTVIDEGLSWYADAHKFCSQQAKLFGVSTSTVAGVVAALSPGNRWDRNKLDAVSCLTAASRDMGVETWKSSTYGVANKIKAARIASGEHPLEVLGGNKVRAFYTLIDDPSDSFSVCVDGHAVQIALAITDEAIDKVPSMTAKVYNRVADAYREAADDINSSVMFPHETVTPAQVQAICWVLHRIKKGVVRPQV